MLNALMRQAGEVLLAALILPCGIKGKKALLQLFAREGQNVSLCVR